MTDGATKDMTLALSEREVARGAASGWYGPLGRTGLTVSRFGFGTFRVVSDAESHQAALALALDSGVNLIDTSPTFGGGDAECAVGAALTTRPRGEVVVISKVGYLPQGQPRPPNVDAVELGRGVAYSLHPEAVSRSLAASQERLGTARIDVVLLQAPEAWLEVAVHKGGRDAALVQIFEHLEGAVAAGQIGHYGVCSNGFVATFGAGSEAHRSAGLGVDELVRAAHAVAGDDHHLAVLQVPLNLVEMGMARPDGDGGVSVLAAAARHGLAVVSNRPLNALTDRGMLRLVELPVPAGPTLARATKAARFLEAELEEGLLRAIRNMGLQNPPDLAFSGAMIRRADELREPVRFAEWVEGRFTADLGDVVQRLESRLTSPLKVAFRFWLERYVAALTDLTSALHARCIDEASARVRAVTALPRHLLGPRNTGLSSAQVALLSLAGIDELSAVLVGMRDPAYVRDTLELRSSPRPSFGVARVLSSLAPSSEVSLDGPPSPERPPGSHTS